MKNILFLLVIMSLCFSCRSQSSEKPISIGHIDSISSDLLHETRPLWIYTPSFDTTTFTRPEYPVLYLLDGDAHFSSVMSMIRQLSAVDGNTVLPQMIIVGIPNTRNHRPRDLTPTSNASLPSSGGGERFTDFLEKELIPYIDKKYATAPYRVLVGHSLGGLMVMNTLIHHTTLFNAYLAIDPSMWYDDENLLSKTDAILKQRDFKGRSLYLAIANTMSPGMDTLRVRKDTSGGTHHIRAILKLADDLRAHPGNDLRWNYKYYDDDSHGSVPLIAEYDGLRFLFSKNRFPANIFFDNKYSADSLKQLIIAHYAVLSQEMGYSIRPEEPFLNQLGYGSLQQKDFVRSKMFFQLNILFYPASFNVYDSMGDYYIALNEKDKAIGSLTKALSIRNWPETREKLEKLKAGK